MSRIPRSVFFLLFTVSGFAGLVYESIWSHYLKLFLGHAAYAQTLVLALFMGGMAIGSWLCSRWSGAWGNLLRGYAFAEGLIGLAALAFHPVFVAATDAAYANILPALGGEIPATLFKWTLAGLLILPQSVLLGVTFPLMSAGLIRRYPAAPGESLAMLYFTNSFGASIGVLASGFIMIEKLGLPGTVQAAGTLNLALAAAVWLLARGTEEPMRARPGGGRDSEGGAPFRLFLAVALLTGAASFVFEIGWIRMLSLVLGSSTHSFELMLSAFILGLACGGYWVRRRIDSIADPVRFLGIVLVTMGLLALATLPLYGEMFGLMQAVMHHGLHQPEHLAIERQRGEREQAHRHQHDAEEPDRVGDRVDAPAQPIAPAGEPQDEGREHQLERVRRGPEHEREHADPADLEDERSRAGEEGDREKESERRRAPGIPPRSGASPYRLLGAAGEQPHDSGESEIQGPGALHRARQPELLDHEEPARQHADRSPEAVGEIEHRERFAGRRWIAPDQPGAHQGKGHAEQNRLRQDQESGERPLEKRRRNLAAECRQNVRVGGVRRGHEDRVEREGREPDQAFRERVAAKEISPGSRPAAAEPRPDRHAAHEQRQHERLRVGRMPEKEFQVVAPDRFVDEAGKPGYGEQQKKYASGNAAHVRIVGRMVAGAGIIRAGCRGA